MEELKAAIWDGWTYATVIKVAIVGLVAYYFGPLAAVKLGEAKAKLTGKTTPTVTNETAGDIGQRAAKLQSCISLFENAGDGATAKTIATESPKVLFAKPTPEAETVE